MEKEGAQYKEWIGEWREYRKDENEWIRKEKKRIVQKEREQTEKKCSGKGKKGKKGKNEEEGDKLKIVEEDAIRSKEAYKQRWGKHRDKEAHKHNE